MIAARILSAILLAAFPSLAADGWALSDQGQASRRVTVTLSWRDRPVETWILPVAKDAPELPNHVVSRWVTFPEERPPGVPGKLVTDTWLGTVDSREAWVRFMWWPSEHRDGGERLKNDYIIVPFGRSEATRLDNGLRIVVTYESAS